MITRIRRNDPIELHEGMRVVLSYAPENKGVIKTLGTEVSYIRMMDKSYRLICNEHLKPEVERKRVRK
jgi:hypothetical protein